MRLLHLRHDYERCGPAEQSASSEGRRNYPVHGRKYLPVRHLPEDHCRDPARCLGAEDAEMSRKPAAPSVNESTPDKLEHSLLSPASEPERYELNSAPAYQFELDRRGFFKLAG